LLVLSAGSAMASTNALGLDPTLNLLVFQNFAPTSSDVEGRVAVGGNATMSSYSINAHNLAGTALTVGGNLDFSNGNITGNTVVGGNLASAYGGSYSGNVAVGGNLNASNGISGGSNTSVTVWGSTTGYSPYYQRTLVQGSGSFSQGVNFNALQTSLTGLSTRLDTLAAGSAIDVHGTLNFNASNANGINVFDITGLQAAQNMQINGLGASGTVIINVLGSTVDFGNHGFTNFNNRVLFNLPTATLLTIASVDASILAPLASVNGGYGRINGQVVVNNWASSVQINDVPFAGNVPLAPVPEPETYAMLLAGLGLIGAAVKRRKAQQA
jgi:choice-of-anchor A domain-containing protein